MNNANWFVYQAMARWFATHARLPRWLDAQRVIERGIVESDLNRMGFK